MPATETPPQPPGPARWFAWQRLKVALGVAFAVGVLIMPTWEASYLVLFGRMFAIGLSALLAFGLFERWPARLPRWLERWIVQVAAVAIAMPITTTLVYFLTTLGDRVPWWRNPERLTGFGMMTFLSLLIAPWITVGSLLTQIRGAAQKQALAFELERSQFERNALDARLRLLQAQVEPHFLFNTLANVRELVDAGSAQASTVLGSLIAYLRAAVPRLHETSTTLGQEIDLVRAYLEVMHMRMPDRLQFTLQADDDARLLVCPPMTLLTLVENAVRHGIDPSEEGGRIEVRVRLRDGRCHADVIDTGVGLVQSGNGLGTGLANLRERLQLAFAGDAQLRLSALAPHGACAEIDFPARRSSP